MTSVPIMARDDQLARLESRSNPWDVIVIGGGATGLGTAVDAASRGFHTVLLEQSDFGKATSSRSTKLIHGGVRYLQQGNLSLVFEALRERGTLLRNAPHVTRNMEFIVPCYRWWEKAYYGTGLKIYDRMAGDLSLGASRIMSRDAVVSRLRTVRARNLRGGVIYHDGQFDDARLALNLAQTASELGGVVLNYVQVVSLTKHDGRIAGVVAADVETGREMELEGRVVVNATGVFADAVRRMDQPDVMDMVRPSQGIHIVLDRSYLPGDTALMIPRTEDGRVLFAVPWHDRLLIGTTDTPLDEVRLEPHPLESEIAFLLDHASRYLDRPVRRSDVRSIFAGLRPLVSSDADTETASISRDHVLHVSRSGLITITGGKWTTYRRMAEDTVNKAIKIGSLEDRPCETERLPVHGWTRDARDDDPFAFYGADRASVAAIVGSIDRGPERVHPRLHVLRGEVRWAARHEMARTVEDVLSRRTRALLLDAAASYEAARVVAEIMADELDRDRTWIEDQVRTFQKVASGYMLDGRTIESVRNRSSSRFGSEVIDHRE